MIAPKFHEVVKVFNRIGCLSFGGPAGQIAMLHRELVDTRKWISEKDYLGALNFCMLLPGPEAMQLATYMGWRLHGLRGGLAAGLLFVLPGSFVVLALAAIYAQFGKVPWIEALFFGVKAAVLAIVLEALLRVAKRALKLRSDWIIALAAFIAIFCFALPFPLIIVVAALFGFLVRGGETGTITPFPPAKTLLAPLAIGAVIWLAPLAALHFSGAEFFTAIAQYFGRLAIVTFGGAYAVLGDMAETVVAQQGWLTPPEMIDSLALAETTPGPLILVTEFVGYLAAYKNSGSIWLAIAAAVLTLWMTFVPSFAFIFAGAPYIEAINARPRLKGALSAITAAVVGVILNLSIWFALHVMFENVARIDGVFKPWMPEWSTFEWRAAVLGVAAAFFLLKRHWGVVEVLIAMSLAGVALLSI